MSTPRESRRPAASRRRLVSAGGVLTISSVLAACSAGGGTAGEAPRKARSAPYTVHFLILPTQPWGLEQFDRFNREVGPALKVQVAPEPEKGQAELWTKFQVTLAAGDPPDVARLKEIWVFEAYLRGAMQPLDGYFKTDKEFNANDLLPLYQDDFKYKGQHFAIAREVSIIVGYYNKANFTAAGLDPNKPPTTYEEFREYARRTTKAGPTPAESLWGFDPYEYGTREFVLLWLFLHLRRFGAGFWNGDKTGVVLNTPTHVEVMQLFVDMIHKDRSTIPPGVSVPQGRTTGKVAVWDQGTWDIPVLPRTAPDLNFGVFPWPRKANQQHTPLSGSSAMTKASKDHDAAWEFIKWWNSPENQVGWYLNANGNAPSRKSVYTKPPFSDDAIWKPLLPLITEGNSPPRPMAERYTELAETMTPSLMKGFRGEVTAKEALDEATRIGTTFWKDIGGSAAKAL